MRGWRVLLFDPECFEELLAKASWPAAIVLLVLCVALQAMPTSWAELTSFHIMIAYMFMKYVIMFGLLLLLLDRLEGTQSMPSFIVATSLTTIYAMGVLVVLSYLALFFFDRILRIGVVSSAVRAFAPYYSVVLFGWCAESVSGIPSTWKRTFFGLAAITLLMVYILYSNIPLCALGVVGHFGLEPLLCV